MNSVGWLWAQERTLLAMWLSFVGDMPGLSEYAYTVIIGFANNGNLRTR